MGLITDRVYVDDLLNQAARQFVEGEIYSDDALPTGRFDSSISTMPLVCETIGTAGPNGSGFS